MLRDIIRIEIRMQVIIRPTERKQFKSQWKLVKMIGQYSLSEERGLINTDQENGGRAAITSGF